MDKRLETYFDENLRDLPRDPEGLKSYTVELEESLKLLSDPLKRASLLGQLGVHLRTLGHLDQAEFKLKEALRLVESNDLGIQREVVQKIRLAHVLQWKKYFRASDELFKEIINVCRSNKDAEGYLDFALQHAGKNLYDQNRLGEALVLFQEALQIRIKKSSPQDQIESTQLAIQRTKALLSK